MGDELRRPVWALREHHMRCGRGRAFAAFVLVGLAWVSTPLAFLTALEAEHAGGETGERFREIVVHAFTNPLALTTRR